jgi:hypothetical protein
MARIVYGLGASHSPMLTLEGKRWSERAADDMRNPSLNTSDGRFVSYAELARENGAPYGDVATEERFLEVEAASQSALDRLADEIEAGAPDVVVIVGDDQQELFSAANMPAVSGLLRRARHHASVRVQRTLAVLARCSDQRLRDGRGSRVSRSSGAGA